MIWLITNINKIDKILLRFYQLLTWLIQPLVLLRLLLRSRKHPAYRKRWAERYGFYKSKVLFRSIVLHSVSVGETHAATYLVRALRYHYPFLPMTVTTMTPTGSDCVQSLFGKDVNHVYLPYDISGSINRFLKQIDPIIVIIMETELWPNLIHSLHKRKIPLVIANARLSARSAASYKKVSVFIRNMLHLVTIIAAKSQEDGNRFVELGLKSSQLAVTGNLKFDISVTQETAIRVVALRCKWELHSRPVWIAASTHNGEELILLESHKKLLKKYPKLLLILVPRHPERFTIAKDLVSKAGFTYTLRSSGENPSDNTQIVIGDTIGELMLLYGISDLAFIGGSLVKCGGHNPLEAAAHAIPVLMGPHTCNFNDICTKLLKSKALITVFDIESLVKEIEALLANEDYRCCYGQHALEVLYQNQGALQRLLQLLEPHLPPKSY